MSAMTPGSESTRRPGHSATYRTTWRGTLASGTSNVIGLIAGDIENSFFATVARGLADVVEEFGYTLIVANSDENVARERRALDSLRANRVDGLVVAPANSNEGDHLAEASAAGTPIVLLDRTVRGLGVDSAVSDGLAGATAAVKHLLGRGHRRIGIVLDAADAPLSSMTMRLRGWTQAMRGAGLSPDDSLVAYASSPMQDGYAATLELLRRPRPPTAVFTASNFMTIGALRALRELNIVLPRSEPRRLRRFRPAQLVRPACDSGRPTGPSARQGGRQAPLGAACKETPASRDGCALRPSSSFAPRASSYRTTPARNPSLCAAEGPKTPSLPFRNLDTRV